MFVFVRTNFNLIFSDIFATNGEFVVAVSPIDLVGLSHPVLFSVKSLKDNTR